MRSLPLLIIAMLMAACTSPPIARPVPTFSGDYIDARKDSAARIEPVHKAPLRVPVYLIEHDIDASAVVAFMVETDGRTSEVQIVSTTDDEFAEAVCESLLRWRYAPPIKDGAPVRLVLEESIGYRYNRYPRTP
jgi:hypothetical protein